MAKLIAPQVPPTLHVPLTWAYLVLVIILSVIYWWDYAKLSSLERLSDPVSVVADSIGPELQYFQGLETLPAWQQRLLNFPGLNRAEFIEQAVKTWQQVIDLLQTGEFIAAEQELHAAQIHLLVLLAEERGWPAAETELKNWHTYSNEAVDYLRTLYARQKYTERPNYFPVEAYQHGWTDLHIQRRAAKLKGDTATAKKIDKQLAAAANRQIQRTIVYSLIWWSLMIVGLAVIVRNYSRYLTSGRQYQRAWHGMDAIGVFVRAELLMTFVLLLEGYVFLFFSDYYATDFDTSLYYAWPSLWRGLIAVALIYLFLTRPRATSMREVFGLSLQRTGGLMPLLLWVVAIVSMDNVGAIVFAAACDGLGCNAPWAEGLSENILWGSPTEVALEAIDTVIWAPIFEEIVFRGVLYLGFRQWFSPLLAALFSSLIFAFLHFYSLAGFIGVMWTGFIFAIAFEYSRSLLPAIGAHILTNLHWLLYSLLFYR